MSEPKKQPKDKSIEIQDLPRQEEELTPEQAEQAQGGMRKAGGDPTTAGTPYLQY